MCGFSSRPQESQITRNLSTGICDYFLGIPDADIAMRAVSSRGEGRRLMARATCFDSESSVKMIAGGASVGFDLSRSSAAARRCSNVPLRFAWPIMVLSVFSSPAPDLAFPELLSDHANALAGAQQLSGDLDVAELPVDVLQPDLSMGVLAESATVLVAIVVFDEAAPRGGVGHPDPLGGFDDGEAGGQLPDSVAQGHFRLLISKS